MTKTMKGAILPGNSTVEIKDFEIPKPGHGQVLVQTKASTFINFLNNYSKSYIFVITLFHAYILFLAFNFLNLMFILLFKYLMSGSPISFNG